MIFLVLLVPFLDVLLDLFSFLPCEGYVFTGVCLSTGEGGLYGGVSIQGGLCPREGSLSKGGISVRGGLCPGGPGGSLSRGGVSVQGRGLCPGEGSLSRGGVSVQGRGLCPGEGSLSRGGVSVQGRGLCPGEGSLSRGGVSVQGGLCQ